MPTTSPELTPVARFCNAVYGIFSGQGFAMEELGLFAPRDHDSSLEALDAAAEPLCDYVLEVECREHGDADEGGRLIQGVVEELAHRAQRIKAAEGAVAAETFVLLATTFCIHEARAIVRKSEWKLDDSLFKRVQRALVATLDQPYYRDVSNETTARSRTTEGEARGFATWWMQFATVAAHGDEES